MNDKLISDERIAHMHGVAEFMYENAPKFNCKTLNRQELYFLGLNHDIGYMFGAENHENDGGRLLAPFLKDGHQNLIAHCIYWHGTLPEKYIEHFGEENIPPELLLLWYADLMVESTGPDTGKVVGLDRRLERLKERWGPFNIEYKRCVVEVKWLREKLDFLNEDVPKDNDTSITFVELKKYVSNEVKKND